MSNTRTSGGMPPDGMRIASMNPLGLMIHIAIGNAVGWFAMFYVKAALPGPIGHVLVNTQSAAGTACLILRFAPTVNGIGVCGNALNGAAALHYVPR